MLHPVETILRDVRVAIDMNRLSDSLAGIPDVDTLSLDQIIRSKIEAAARLVEGDAPTIMLDRAESFIDEDGKTTIWEKPVSIDPQGKGVIPLDNSFFRLVSFKMASWKRTLFHTIDVTDPLYSLQSSKWKGVFGTPQKPVAALVRNSKGKQLQFWSSESDEDTVEDATYLSYPAITKQENEESLIISDDCYEAFVYRCAALVLDSLGDKLSQTMLEISNSLLQV